MKIIVAIIVYDRLQNIEEWIRCWRMCQKEGAEFMIIHNWDTEEQQVPFRTLCETNNVTYIPRKNIGMDIGAFQDVCRGRLEGFPNQWDYLFWCPDDTIPMSKKFIPHYLAAIRKKLGVVCLEISKEVKTHIRTTGFMIDQKTASLVEFPAPTVTTKGQCYEFEHYSKNAFYEQMKKLNRSVTQIHPDLRKSYLWDTHSRGNFRRWGEHYNEFPK